MAYQQLAGIDARLGDFAAAKATAAAIAQPLGKLQAYADIAILEARAGHFADAKATAKLAESQQNPRVRLNTLARLAQQQAKAGDVAGALATVADLGPRDVQLEAYLDIADAQVKAGDGPGALQTLKRCEPLPDDRKVERFRAKLAFVYATAGDLDAAARLAPPPMQPRQRAAVYAFAAAGCQQAGDSAAAQRLLKEADSLVASIADPRERRKAESQALEPRLMTGDFDGALRTVGGWEDAQSRDFALMRIAQLQAEAGNLPAARQTLAGASTASQPDAATRVAFAQARQGDLAALDAWITSVSDHALRASLASAAARGVVERPTATSRPAPATSRP